MSPTLINFLLNMTLSVWLDEKENYCIIRNTKFHVQLKLLNYHKLSLKVQYQQPQAQRAQPKPKRPAFAQQQEEESPEDYDVSLITWP